jgi:hypothetical protein
MSSRTRHAQSAVDVDHGGLTYHWAGSVWNVLAGSQWGMCGDTVEVQVRGGAGGSKVCNPCVCGPRSFFAGGCASFQDRTRGVGVDQGDHKMTTPSAEAT